ncbi:hypothetical protein BYT27DRAFT_7198199 [Phlegmacium glaucopus]|nr:hypothetical protein BYT27DRAFT_7198199 [Phlegmacium glaucopus]
MATVQLSDLSFGDLISTDVMIDIRDLLDPNSKTTTAKKIKKGLPTRRLCVVLVTGSTSIGVTYLATFNRQTVLPDNLNQNLWYPIKPAEKGDQDFDPLPGEPNGEAQWASLRRIQYINGEFDKKSGILPVASAEVIKAAMHT